MRKLRIGIFVSGILGIGVLCLAVPSAATIHRVPDTFPRIQQAITFSVDGDTVLVEPGTYAETIDFLGRDILVGSRYIVTGDPAYIGQTVIGPDGDVEASVVTFATGETQLARLSGFTITNGYAVQGGGIYCNQTSPTIDHLHIVENSAVVNGGGMYAFEGMPSVSDCRIAHNTAQEGDGGGIWAQYSDIVIHNNEIHANHAWFRGAGIFCEHSYQTITDNLVTDNVIDRPPPLYSYGGGIVSRNCSPIITGNTMIGNDGGGHGGGMFY